MGPMQSWDDQIKNLFSDWLFFMVWDQCNLGTIKSKTCFQLGLTFFQGMGPMQSWDGQIKNLFSIRIDFFRFGRCVVLYWKRKKKMFFLWISFVNPNVSTFQPSKSQGCSTDQSKHKCYKLAFLVVSFPPRPTFATQWIHSFLNAIAKRW